MADCQDYFDVLTNPTEEKINEAIEILKKCISRCEIGIDNQNDKVTKVPAGSQIFYFADMNRLYNVMTVHERRMDKLIELREKSCKNKKILCGVCGLEEKGLSIPETPIQICTKCIYSTVLEHHAKKDWQKDLTTQNETKEGK